MLLPEKHKRFQSQFSMYNV